MNNMHYRRKMEGASAIKSNTNAFVLWREVLMAYVSPAVMAGLGGLITADRNLQIGALTTIGGASAIMAWLLGLWLRSKGGDVRWMIRMPRIVAVTMFAIIGASLGLLTAWATLGLLEMVLSYAQWDWIQRVWFDFPLSGAIACTIMTWRWRQSRTTSCFVLHN
ncbi:hypothetical protein [Paenibacillus sp. RC67]|uniref:hypothetical protein n=1 Tax=Paenibacillus sp. RC67 TaxID=3039392 RepID=UPI0024AC955F|nr:hypothetical protein [Paenibacillus sp. RC67]